MDTVLVPVSSKVLVDTNSYTVEPLNVDTFGTRPKCPVYRGVHITGALRNVDTWGIGQVSAYFCKMGVNILLCLIAA